MKNTTTNANKKTYAIMIAMLFSITAFSQSHVTMSLKNISSTKNTIEYDLYIVNDGTTSLRLSGCSYGINFDPTITNGGHVTFSYNQHSRGQALQGLTDFSLGVANMQEYNQVRVTTTISKSDKSPVLIANMPYKVGRFKMSNSHNWTANSKPSFTLQEMSYPGLTNTQIVAYVNNESNLTSFTSSQHTVATKVEESIVLNQLSTTDNGQTVHPSNDMMNEKISLYPNPVSNELNIELVTNAKGSVNISIDDLNGRTIKQIQSDIVEGLNTLLIDVRDVAKGMYTIKIDDHQSINQRLKFTKL